MDPLQHTAAELASGLAAQRDRILRDAISQVLGHGDWQPEDLAGRCSCESSPARDRYFLDGRPLVEFYAVETDTRDLWPGGHELTGRQHFRLLGEGAE